MDDGGGGRRWLGGETVVGGLLLLLGILVLLGQALHLELGRVGWPVLVIVPGLGLLGLGLSAAGRLGEVLAMVGGVVTMAGLVLLVQNATDRFETWAYSWTLVLLVAFVVFAVFFEIVIGVGGHRSGASGRYALAALLIAAGLVLLGRRLLVTRRS